MANPKDPWLLVLDGADDLELDYFSFIPNSPLGVVIMTSRNSECHRYATVEPLELGGLSQHASQQLLLKAADRGKYQPNKGTKAVVRTAELLQSHPLALIQTGTYISHGHCRIEEYPHVYEKQRKRLLQYRSNQAQARYRHVYATFEVAWNSL